MVPLIKEFEKLNENVTITALNVLCNKWKSEYPLKNSLAISPRMRKPLDCREWGKLLIDSENTNIEKTGGAPGLLLKFYRYNALV